MTIMNYWTDKMNQKKRKKERTDISIIKMLNNVSTKLRNKTKKQNCKQLAKGKKKGF